MRESMPNCERCKSRDFRGVLLPACESLLLLLLLLLLLACGSSVPKSGVPAEPAASALDLSSVVIPIHASLAPLLPLVEAQVPKSLVSKGDYEMDSAGRFGVRYRIERDAIDLNQQGAGLHATTHIRYAVEACHRTWNPVTKRYSMWPCVSCGFGEPMREAIIHLHTHLDWDPEWRLRSTTAANPVEFPNRCGITVLNIDITDWKVAPLISGQLRDLARSLDQNTPRVTNIRREAERVWSALQTPIDVGSRSWLVVDPLSFGMSAITGSGTTIGSSLLLTAQIRLVVGEPPRTPPRPLPPLRTAAGASGLRIPLAVEVSYEEASRLLSAEIAGRTYRISGHELRVESVRLAPAKGRLSIEATIDYRGGGMRDYRGIVHLEGMPLYDPATAAIVVGDLDYSLDSGRHNPFVRVADRLAHEGVRASLAQNARLRISAQLESSRRQVSSGLNRPLAPNVTLHGSVDRLEPTSIVALPDRISIAVIATGSASLDVR
jgi:ribosomal protein L37AE/L43A